MTTYEKINITGSKNALFASPSTATFTAKELLDALSLNHDYLDGMKIEWNSRFQTLKVTIPKYEAQGFDFASLLLFRLSDFKKTNFANYRDQITIDSSSTYISKQALEDLTELVYPTLKANKQVSFSDKIETIAFKL